MSKLSLYFRFDFYQHRYILMLLVWSALIAASLLWNIYQVHTNILLTATTAAKANIGKDISVRKWAASHGGVYVSPTETTPANPYLKIPERDILTTKGKELTLMNPAYILRELQTNFHHDYISRSHITSLKPINPNNAPDEWEAKALLSFEQGNSELLEMQHIDGKPYLRLMLPFKVEQSCLQCHVEQGYQLGQIRGGISTSVSLTDYLQQRQKRGMQLLLSHGVIWLFGVIGEGIFYRYEQRLNHKRTVMKNKLALSEQRASSLLELSMRASNLNEKELLQASLERVEKLTNSLIAYAHFVNDDQETISLGTWSENTLQVCAAIYDNHYPISQAGVWADCFRERRSIVFNDYAAVTEKKGLPKGHSVLVRSMNVPVIEEDKVRMIIGVGNKANDYDESDLRELELAATSLWSLLKRKRAELEVQQYGLRLEELVKIRTHELLKAKQAAEAANIAKSSFIANMSHELRTPLNAVLGFSELMSQDESITAAQKDTLNIINRSGTHLLNMINDVLDISKIEAGHVELTIESCDLIKLLQDIGDMISVRTTSKHLNFVLEIAPNIKRYIAIDSGKLRQVLINLLGNAVKFTQHGGIILRANNQQDNDTLLLNIEVIDSGIGIAKEYQADLFKPFVQLAQKNADTKGTGLGLAISKSLVELMGGKISISSVIDVGSTFKISLPVTVSADNVLPEPEYHPVEHIAPNQPAWRLLVVDDNEENRLLLVALLSKVGFQVREAENGQQAINIFKDWQPHLIWMDMRMPVLDGYQASMKIRLLSGGDKVKIIAITASAFKEQHRNIINAGCDAVVHKPFHSSEIFTALTNVLDVKFIYSTPTHQPSPVLETKLQQLDTLPENLRQQLHEAVLTLDTEAIDMAIADIRHIAPDIANNLQNMANQYQFEQMLHLLNAAN